MKIVKEFEDPEFLKHPKISSIPHDYEEYKWIWGLSDDGNIYYRCTRFSHPDQWNDLRCAELVATCISLRDMKRFVKEFGHLLVWL